MATKQHNNQLVRQTNPSYFLTYVMYAICDLPTHGLHVCHLSALVDLLIMSHRFTWTHRVCICTSTLQPPIVPLHLLPTRVVQGTLSST